ncbi:response regulator transcription factor [Achromobacter aegrifaciens]|uniref:response regulator transcription factor n=1 Tax=Achromobacter aegrifaciens TaxID=1287736 RepID=UPI0027B97049|nr:response regulator transcription factor [Achromobacter aegrifaciens]WLW63582.1 response regulator transcription factor [Achromobacter aegrifaciens]
MEKIRVLLADDHPLTLVGIQDLLERDVNIVVTASASTSTELVEQLNLSLPDVIITDYTMPGDNVYGDGIRFVDYLIRTYPTPKLLVLTMISNPMIISTLYNAGVWGVVMKHDKLTEILGAIRCLQLGNKYFPPNYTQNARRDYKNSSVADRIKLLSPREYEVLRHFVRGDTVVQIAANLKRSVKTVSTQKTSAMEKLNVQSNQELIAFCVEHGLFE